MIVYFNGKRVDANGIAKAEYLSDEFMSVFESVRTYGGKFFRLGDHLERLFESAETVGMALNKSKDEIVEEMKAALSDSGLKEAFVRVTFLKDSRHFIIVCPGKKYPSVCYTKGVEVRTAATRRNLIEAFQTEAKTGSFMNQILGCLDGSVQDSFECVFLDSHGLVSEARTSNIFMIKDDILQTPLNLGILNGITRQVVIECAASLGIPFEEEKMTRHDFFNADEMFLTNTSGELMPVRSMDGRKIGKTCPGVLTLKLRDEFHKKVREEMENA